jgi:hypothetical protein
LDRRLIGSKSLKLNEFLMTVCTALVRAGSASAMWDEGGMRLSYATGPKRQQAALRMK